MLTPDNLDYYALCWWACTHINWCQETFYVFRRTKSHNLWKWIKFQTSLYLLLYKHFPAAWSLNKTQHTLLSFWISRIYSATLTTFSGILTASYILPCCNSCCLPFPDKNKRKKPCFDSTLGKHAYKAFEWEAKTVWAIRGSRLT